MAVEALKLGKHVISAVPAAMSVQEAEELLSVVKQTGRKYMMAETSRYRQEILTCIDWARKAASAKSSIPKRSITTLGWRLTPTGAVSTVRRAISFAQLTRSIETPSLRGSWCRPGLMATRPCSTPPTARG